ncbi:MAG TPA: immunoglobulin domain-containing protein [Verrucomicrobiae bacterium]|nr:immunoglobulin domain-containing protein [Verrucomicrobiae bacterium]
MQRIYRIILMLVVLLGLTASNFATVYLDDFWSDGLRTTQNLPTESAWFASSSGSLAATPGSMNLSMGSSAILVLTYYTTNSTSPVQLGVGDALTATFNLTFSGLAASNTSQGFRIGLFDFADSTLSPKRVTADGFSSSSQGAGVQGYALLQNMSPQFNNSTPMDIRKRTTLTDNSLLGTSSDYTSLGTGPGNVTAFPGFSNGTNYILQITLQRTATNTMAITASWLNTANGATLITSETDTGATNFNFDGIGLRPLTAASTATTITFQEAKVEFIPANTPATVTSDPQDQAVFVGQNASFGVLASGSPPLSYQWYYNGITLLTNATSATLTLTNCQISDSGQYSVIVSNTSGVDTSGVANLSVTIPTAPSIGTQPQGGTVLPGSSFSFNVVAGGSQPLTYQWFLNNTTTITGGNDSTLTLTNIQPGQAGNYSVLVSNLAGTATSSNAVLIVNTNPVAPVFISQPSSQIALAGTIVNFTAAAAGTAPITYQWSKNNVAIAGATATTFSITNVQTTDDGNYSVTASNNVGGTTSGTAQLTVTPPVPVPLSAYNLVGFGQGTTGGGVLADTDPNYAKVFTAIDLANALISKTVRVIEIMNDLNLGYNEIPAAAKATSEPFRADSTPLLHPVLLTTGVSLIDIQKKNGLTIFSANGSTIRHAHLNIKAGSNIIVRNLKFDQLWEWDEATKGNYDKNNWDFMTIGDSGSITGLWIDHCTFTKAYDGIVDIKNGSAGITISWCKYTGDDGATNNNSWVWQQINALESNKASYVMYNTLRTAGFSSTDIVTVIQGHDKTHLIGANDMDPNNALHTVTLHHEWFINPWDRLPRLRGGNVHDYNIYVDDTAGIAAKHLRDSHPFSSSYSFNPFLNGSISTENGATLVEKSVYIDCITPLRNNQTDPSNPAYTGKILALDTIYVNPADGSVTRGNSTDPGSQLGPFQAPIIPFSWNLAGNQLPYTYFPDDPSQLQGIVTSPTAGAGAGVLTWAKTNWLVTSYAPTAPVIVAGPQNQSVSQNTTISFTVVAGGSAPLSYQWYFNTNSPIAGATNFLFTLANIQATNAGIYSAIVSNSVGSTNSAGATLTVNVPTNTDPFAAWQNQYFTPDELANPSFSGPDADPLGKGMSNTNQFLAGLNPTNPASALRIISAVKQDSDVSISWTTAGAHTNAVQATGGDGSGGYSTNFTDISGPIIITGSGDATTNYADSGGATNNPARYYRVRLVP